MKIHVVNIIQRFFIGIISSDPKFDPMKNRIVFFQDSTSINDKSMFVHIDLDITLASRGVIMSGAAATVTELELAVIKMVYS